MPVWFPPKSMGTRSGSSWLIALRTRSREVICMFFMGAILRRADSRLVKDCGVFVLRMSCNSIRIMIRRAGKRKRQPTHYAPAAAQ